MSSISTAPILCEWLQIADILGHSHPLYSYLLKSSEHRGRKRLHLDGVALRHPYNGLFIASTSCHEQTNEYRL